MDRPMHPLSHLVLFRDSRFREVDLSYSIVRMVEASCCEALLRDMNDFIGSTYSEANARARRAHVYQHQTDMEAFAFPVHSTGSPQTDHLPGFRLDELPGSLAEICRGATRALRIERGRVLFNVGRYPEGSSVLPPHYDGELFDYTITPGVGNWVRSGIRPTEVALLTLRNETERCGTSLHDADGKIVETHAQPGELLVFDNTTYQHGVPATGPNVVAGPNARPPRWVRYVVGWRALEEGYYWNDAEPLRPIAFEEAIALHDRFLANDWPSLIPSELARGSFPYPTRHV